MRFSFVIDVLRYFNFPHFQKNYLLKLLILEEEQRGRRVKPIAC